MMWSLWLVGRPTFGFVKLLASSGSHCTMWADEQHRQAGFESRLVPDLPLPFIPTLIGLRAFDLVSSRVWWEAATNTLLVSMRVPDQNMTKELSAYPLSHWILGRLGILLEHWPPVMPSWVLWCDPDSFPDRSNYMHQSDIFVASISMPYQGAILAVCCNVYHNRTLKLSSVPGR